VSADEVIHQPVRLRIMATLSALPDGERIAFTRLKAILNATDGNLGAHLTTLENAGYVAIEKDFVAKKPRTRVAMTRAGRRAFAQHVAYLRDIIDGAGAGNAEEKPS
jgi:DNA-binding MarR family transcriptional regulator